MEVEYIIIGGGTTGCVIAGRLAKAGASVAVLEAGYRIEKDDRVDIPANFQQTLGDKELDWCLETTPQAGLGGRRIPLPRGKALGGTSMINTMTWARANKEEYDDIAKLNDSTDWRWDNLLPYFKACETVVAPTDAAWAEEHGATFNPANHGSTGPLRRGYVPWLGETHVPFFQAMNAMGISTNKDSCSGDNLGVFTLSTVIDPSTAKRNSSSRAHFNLKPENITLLEGALVRKVILDHTPTDYHFAKGVEYEQDGVVKTITASREVIISAGSYMTPKILELSGIGDLDLLNKIGVHCHVDLPGVGENLQDHYLIPTSVELKDGIISGDFLGDPDFAAKEMQVYKENGQGQYASMHSAFSLLQPQLVMSDTIAKDILKSAHVDAASSLEVVNPRVRGGVQALYDLQSRWYADAKHGQFEFMHVPQFCTQLASSAKPSTPYLSILAVYMRPFSRGRAHATCSDPHSPPLIDPAYCSNKADMQLLLESVRFARKIVNTEPLASLVVASTDPSPEVLNDDVLLEEYVKKTFETAHHPLGTAAMMPRELGGVVDTELRVYDVGSLRVADASVIPVQLSAHPQATLYAIGEKVSAMILKARNDQPRPNAETGSRGCVVV